MPLRRRGHAGPKEYHLLIQSMRFNEDSTAGEMEELLSSLPAKGIAPPRRSVASVLTKIKEKKEFEVTLCWNLASPKT